MADLSSITRLLLIAFACALLLSATRWLTDTRIDQNQVRKTQQDLLGLLQGLGDFQPADLPDTTTGQRCWKLDDSSLRLTRTVAQGYGGGIDILLTQDAGQLRGLRITAHQETPGIADFLNRYDEGWLSNLTGRTSMELTALDTVTGATITSRAMLDTLTTALNTEDAACTP